MPGKFFGGVHPAQNKSDSAKKEIRTPRSPEIVVIPMLPARRSAVPAVCRGDYVALGQIIGDSDAPVSAPIHASVSGTVVAVEARPHPSGSRVLSVVIANDFKDTPAGSDVRTDVSDLPRVDKRISSALPGSSAWRRGIPTHAKIRSGLGKVDTVIINGANVSPT